MVDLSYNIVVRGNLFKRATSSRQYDSPEVGWTADSKGTNLPIREFILEYLAPHIPNWEGKDLLEIGSGTGWLLDVAYKDGVGSVTGIDPSKRSISLAQKYYPYATNINVSFEEYVPGKKFDIVLSVLSFGHIPNLEAAFKKISQLLKKEGEVFLIVGDYDYYKRQRYGYKIIYEEIDKESYATAVERTHGCICDVIRSVEKYKKAGQKFNLLLARDIPMPPTTGLVSKVPRYSESIGIPMARLLKFVKTNN